MREILRTNDIVLLSFAEALLRDAGCDPFIADHYTSVVEGSVGVLPRRLLVPDAQYAAAVDVLNESDLGQWVRRGDG